VGKGKDRAPLGEGAKDPGRLRFNHQLHLEDGITGNWTFERMAAEYPDKEQAKKYVEHYKQLQKKLQKVESIDDKALMKLDCAACHVLTAADEGRKGSREAGDYVLPINYEQHCKACHPLTFSSNEQLKNVEIPHHLQPEQMRAFLEGAFAKVRGEQVKKAKKGSDTPLPGQDPDEERVREQIGRDAQAGLAFAFQERAEQAGKNTNCRVCHYTEEVKVAAGGKESVKRTIVAPNVPKVWFEHAKFSHKAHHAVDCLSCHGAARNGTAKPEVGAESSTTKDDVLIPRKENCVQCHSPARTVSGVKMGGVRSDCVTCHSYHHGDVPLAGMGAEARGPRQRVGTKDWLEGKFGGK
jgi:hypothetical protein